VGLIGLRTQASLAIRFIVLVVTLEPDGLRVSLEREDVRRDAVQEPAIVTDYNHAARERNQRILQRT